MEEMLGDLESTTPFGPSFGLVIQESDLHLLIHDGAVYGSAHGAGVARMSFSHTRWRPTMVVYKAERRGLPETFVLYKNFNLTISNPPL